MKPWRIVATTIALVLSSNVNAAPTYYIFEGSLDSIIDSAGLAEAQNITTGSNFTVIFLVDTLEAGTVTTLSMYPIYNQEYTQGLVDYTDGLGYTTDYFFSDLISQPLLNGNSWGDRGTIEENNGYYYTQSFLNDVFYLSGSNSPNTTGAVTELTAYYAQLSELVVGKGFSFYEAASTGEGETYLRTSLYGTATLVDVTDNLTTPEPLAFTDITDAALSGVITSDTKNITGITTGVNISITGGEYNLNGTGFTSAAGTANNGDSLVLRTTSSAIYYTTTDVTVTVGSGGDIWRVTTLTDIVPDAFNFTDQSNVALSTLITSDTVVVTGLGASSAITITGGEYSINGGGFLSTPSVSNNNDSVVLRTTSSATVSTSVDVVLNIGGISDTFTVTTYADSDSDGDTVLDSIDNCPAISNVSQTNTDGDAQGDACDADDDNDGANDDVDAFPTNFAASVDADNNGRPDVWNSGCYFFCQIYSGLTLDDSGADSDSGSTNPLLLGLLSLLILTVRRRTML